MLHSFTYQIKDDYICSYDRPSSTNDFYLRDDVQKYGRFLTQSRINLEWINDKDNGLVFVEMPFEEPKKVLFLFLSFSAYLQIIVITTMQKFPIN